MDLPEEYVIYRDAPAYMGITSRQFNILRHRAGLNESFCGFKAVFLKADLDALPVKVESQHKKRVEEKKCAIAKSKAKSKKKNGQVYIIRMGKKGPFKVGYSTDLGSRIRDLQTSAPHPLEVIHHEPGTYSLEYAVHVTLAPFRTRREWFRGSKEVISFIEAAKKHGIRKTLGQVWGELSGSRGDVTKSMKMAVMEEIMLNHSPTIPLGS